jgi:hypothetical protein
MSSSSENHGVSPTVGDPGTPERRQMTVVLPSPQTSNESPSNLSDLSIETLTAPEWKNEDDAIAFFLQVRNALKAIVYKYCTTLKEGKQVFEKQHAEHYKNYAGLEMRLTLWWHKWKQFCGQRHITAAFLKTSAIYFDFESDLRFLASPRNATRASRDQMQGLRDRIKDTQQEFIRLRGQVDDAIARLEERNNGHAGTGYPNLSTIRHLLSEPTPEAFREFESVMDVSGEPEDTNICTEPVPARDDEQEQVDEDENDSQSEDGDAIVARRGRRDENGLVQNRLRPVWTGWGGYPGEIPDDIKEYLDDDGGRRKYYQSTHQGMF